MGSRTKRVKELAEQFKQLNSEAYLKLSNFVFEDYMYE